MSSILLAAALLLSPPSSEAVSPRELASRERVESELARLPFERYMNLILFEVRIGDSGPLTFILDSGASSTVIDDEVADRLSLPMGDPQQGGRSMSGDPLTFRIAPSVSFDVGGYVQELTSVLVAPAQGLARAVTGKTIHGILGHRFLSQVTVEVDYVEEVLVLHDPETYRYAGDGAALPLTFDPSVANLPFTVLEVESSGKMHEVRMLIDSGGSTSDTCGIERAVALEGIVPPEAPRIPAMSMSGLSDGPDGAVHPNASFVTRADRLHIGPYALKRPTVRCGSTLGFSLFGAEVLHRFDVVFDYERERMIVEPNELYEEPLRPDASGMMLLADAEDGDVRRVAFVIPASPAGEAGLQVGDLLIRIDNERANRLGLQETRELFCDPHVEYALTVRRGTESLELVMKTRELL